jgi:hypothetical protein
MRIAMQVSSEWDDLDSAPNDDDEREAEPKSPEDLVDRFGFKTALLVLFAGLFLAAIWVLSGPSFQKCSALETLAQRNVCYGELRDELLKPPAKGP